MNFKDKLRNYAKVVIERGINVQKGMPLVINTSTEAMDFVRLLTELAYERGASDVIVRIQ
ncbi:MAG: aminopeptidase, partial [Fenollaria timonensis]